MNNVRLNRLIDSLERKKLTPSEQIIMKLISEGLSTKEIAAKRKVSVWTVKDQRATAYKKAGVHNRVQVLLWLRSWAKSFDKETYDISSKVRKVSG